MSIKKYVQNCNKGPVHWAYSVFVRLRSSFRFLLGNICNIFQLLPVQNKVIVSTFEGRRYGDNIQFICEELHKINDRLDIVLIQEKGFNFKTPPYIRVVKRNRIIKRVFEYCTAKVWVDTHHIDKYLHRKKNQLFIETWHGGLGIKRIGNDSNKFQNKSKKFPRAMHTAKNASMFVSNSNHLTNIYRRAFDYKGPIWKCGYPKNDILFQTHPEIVAKVKSCLNIPPSTHVVIYAPTFRGEHLKDVGYLNKVYSLDGRRAAASFQQRFGGEWVILFRMHPDIARLNLGFAYDDVVKNATNYPDMQELILACDALISDYSSCIFDAAIRKIPCFTFATDFDEYKGSRGVYYEMNELPFPYAQNNDELEHHILEFNESKYQEAWEAFKIRTGLHETGHSAKDIALVINEFIKGNMQPLKEIKSEP